MASGPPSQAIVSCINRRLDLLLSGNGNALLFCFASQLHELSGAR